MPLGATQASPPRHTCNCARTAQALRKHCTSIQVGLRDQKVLGKSLKHPKSDRYCIWFIQWMYIFLCILCTLLLYMMHACETFLRGCYKITLSINLKLVLRSPQRVTTVCLVSPSRICNQNGHRTCWRHIRAVRVTFGAKTRIFQCAMDHTSCVAANR